MKSIFRLLLAVFLNLGVAAGQDTARAFEDASLSQQQKADILQVTGENSEDPEIPGKPFIDFVQLAADTGKPQVIIAFRGEGGMGNKELWVFEQTAGHAALILAAEGSMYDTLGDVHHGMHDFTTFWNLGGGEGESHVYEFDGKQYHSAYCYDTTIGSEDSPEKDGPHHPCDR
jgi:hypothetical protein